MLRTRTVLSLALITFLFAGFKSNENPTMRETVQWMSFEEAVEKSKTEPRKIFIDVYTDWCGWCKKMDAGTFNNPAVAAYLNEKYYSVKLDAEGKESIEFDNHTFKWVDSGRNGIHELAYALLNGKLSYPTVVFLDEEFKMIQPLPGYQKAPFFEKVIRFYGEDAHKDMSWNEFVADYDSPSD